jgi:hypothetical protein
MSKLFEPSFVEVPPLGEFMLLIVILNASPAHQRSMSSKCTNLKMDSSNPPMVVMLPKEPDPGTPQPGVPTMSGGCRGEGS